MDIDIVISIITLKTFELNNSADRKRIVPTRAQTKNTRQLPGVGRVLFWNDPLGGFAEFLKEEAIQP